MKKKSSKTKLGRDHKINSLLSLTYNQVLEMCELDPDAVAQMLVDDVQKQLTQMSDEQLDKELEGWQNTKRVSSTPTVATASKTFH